MSLTIADRRSISTRSLQQPEFRARLMKDPRAGIREVTGKGELLRKKD